jgi:hypothetical protein
MNKISNKTFNNALFLFITIFLALAINMVVNEARREPFVPAIKEHYNPFIRKTRNYITNKLETFKLNSRVFLKRFRFMK